MSFDRRLWTALLIAVVSLAWSGQWTRAGAQTTSASVSGTVQDSQGGVLPGVTVTLKSSTQANELTTTTDDQGRFTVPIVRPDRYTLHVTLEGF